MPVLQAGRRRLLQNGPRPSTAVAISIEVTGQQQYDTVMADLADMTRPGAGLLALLQAKIPSLQAVQLASAVIILPHRNQHPAGKPALHLLPLLRHDRVPRSMLWSIPRQSEPCTSLDLGILALQVLAWGWSSRACVSVRDLCACHAASMLAIRLPASLKLTTCGRVPGLTARVHIERLRASVHQTVWKAWARPPCVPPLVTLVCACQM